MKINTKFSVYKEPLVAFFLLIILLVGLIFSLYIFFTSKIRHSSIFIYVASVLLLIIYFYSIYAVYYELTVRIDVYDNELMYTRLFGFFKEKIRISDINKIYEVNNINKNNNVISKIMNLFKNFPEEFYENYIIILYKENKKICLLPGVYNIDKLWLYLGGDKKNVPGWKQPEKKEIKDFKRALVFLLIFLAVIVIVFNLF